MSIETKDRLRVNFMTEYHYKIVINEKEVWVSKCIVDNEFETDSEVDIFKGKELITEEEHEEVIEYVENLK